MLNETITSNGICHINKVKLRIAQLVPGLVTTSGVSIILILSRPLRSTQPGPTWVSATSNGDTFGPHLESNGECCVAASLLPGLMECGLTFLCPKIAAHASFSVFRKLESQPPNVTNRCTDTSDP